VPSTPSNRAPFKQKPPESGVNISVEVPVVTINVIATTQHGDLIHELKKENFRILEDSQPQTITNFGLTDVPITIILLMEFTSRYYRSFTNHAKGWAEALLPNLKQEDWLALITLDMKLHMEVDFTQDKNELRQALESFLYFPGFGESNIFDGFVRYRRSPQRGEGQKIYSSNG